MSINSAMLAGVSGLVANSSALAAISDNIANVNTVGYKRNAINFTNLVTSQSVAGRYSAGGVQGATHQYVSQQGLLQTSSSATDIAVSGDGFFIVTEKSAPLTAADSRVFTRAGAFTVDADGYLVNNAGLYLQGWPADANGEVDANPSDLTRMTSINVRNIGATVVPSSEIQVTANLNADTPLAAAVSGGTYNPAVAANSMTAYDATTGLGVKPDFTIQMSVVDSLGGSHTVAVSFLKSATANQWYAEMYAVPASDITNDGTGPAGQIRSGMVAFTPDGQLDTGSATTLFASATNPAISIAASASAAPGAGAVKWSTAQGIAGQDISFDLADATGGLTQFASASTVRTVTSNGAGVGQVTGVQIDEKGFVSAIFDNGEVRKLAQVALATFPNPDGLTPVSGNAYRVSLHSGDYSLKRPGEGGAGDLAGSALEASTVDLSAEFTGLITTQRAYSASSKIIMTADQMMEELLNIKR